MGDGSADARLGFLNRVCESVRVVRDAGSKNC